MYLGNIWSLTLKLVYLFSGRYRSNVHIVYFFILLIISFQLWAIIGISKSNIYTEFDSLIKFCGVVHVRQILHLENIMKIMCIRLLLRR